MYNIKTSVGSNATASYSFGNSAQAGTPANAGFSMPASMYARLNASAPASYKISQVTQMPTTGMYGMYKN